MSARRALIVAITATCAVATAGIDRGGITLGVLESVDPLVVAGTQFDTSQALVMIDGVPRNLLQLAPGQIVAITSHYDGAVIADSIEVDSSLRGAIETVTAQTLTVFGQTVHIDHKTRVAGVGNGGADDLLVVGQRVDVSGFHLPDGSLYATRIDLATAPVDKITGRIDNIFYSFVRIGTRWVNFSQAKLGGFVTSPQIGDQVEAMGTACDPDLLCASTLRRRNPITVATDDEVDLEGFITRYVGPDDFDVDGMRVQTNEMTEHVGLTPGQLTAGDFVTVDGVRAGSIVVAERISAAPGDADGSD